jgi:adenine deaminase
MSYDSFRLSDARPLVDCAMGRTPADRVIRNGQWVCVQTGEIIAHTDVAIVGERIAYVGSDASHTIGAQTEVIDADGMYLVPGLLDGHMHVESGMLTVTEFVRAILPHGTTGIFADPHEIANVFGLQGVRMMVDEARLQPVHVFVQMPACVPSAPGLETPGASLGPAEVAEAMTWPGIIGLGEMMNFPGVAMGDEKLHAEMAVTRLAGKVIGGHYASPDLGLPFHGYVAGGANDDHEGTRLVDAVARARQGMKVMMRYGSAWHDVASQVKAVTEAGVDARGFILCTDDCQSVTLVGEGHMDRVLRHAISEGLEPILAIQMATINTAEHFGLSRDLGMIAPGRYADLLLVKDLRQFDVKMVIARGNIAAKDGRLLVTLPEVQHPDWAWHSIHLARPLTNADFNLHNDHKGQVLAHVIGIIENQAPTRHLRIPMQLDGNGIRPDMARDIAKVALVERHRATGRVQVGLVSGFGFNRPCAVATTVAHDCHHMIIAGSDETDMVMAGNLLAKWGGGQVVVSQGKVIGKVELPIGGLMSNQPVEKVAAAVASVLRGMRECGCQLNSANMQLSLLALVVIPELRISDLGLVDVEHFEVIPVVDAALI